MDEIRYLSTVHHDRVYSHRYDDQNLGPHSDNCSMTCVLGIMLFLISTLVVGLLLYTLTFYHPYRKNPTASDHNILQVDQYYHFWK